MNRQATPHRVQPEYEEALKIPYGRQCIDDSDVAAVCEVLRSNYLTQGSAVPSFEKVVKNYCGVRYAVAACNGTAALHMACMALGLGPGDTLWTSPITFVASANCGLYCGASVDFVDIDPRTYNLCPQALEKKLESAKREKRLPKVVIPVHLCGQPCDMKVIAALSQKYGFHVIEDASHALGAQYRNEPVGNSKYSDITVFSFHPVKIITTGEGGMAMTNSADLSRRMRLLCSHGITRDPDQMTHEPDGPWYYQQIELGYNYRMSDIQGALGISQMRRLDEFVTKRRKLAQRYDKLLADLPLVTPWQNLHVFSAWHLYVVRIQQNRLKLNHYQIFKLLREQGIGVNLHYIPVYTQPYFRKMRAGPWIFPEAEKYYQEAITLPLFPSMSTEQQNIVVNALKKAIQC